MKDRIPTYPGRVRLTPVSGQENVFDLERADEPRQAGTPLNKSTLLDNVTAERLGGNENTTPNDALNLAIDESAFIIGDVVLSGQIQTENWVECDGSVIDEDEMPEFYKLQMPSSKISTYTFPVVQESQFSDPNEPLQEVNGYHVAIVGCGFYYKRKDESQWVYVDVLTNIKTLHTIYSTYFKLLGIAYLNGKYVYAGVSRSSSSGNSYIYYYSSDSLSEPPDTVLTNGNGSSYYIVDTLYTSGEYIIHNGLRILDGTMATSTTKVTPMSYDEAFPNSGMSLIFGAEFIENRWVVVGQTITNSKYYPTIAIGQVGKKAKETSWYIFKAPNGSTDSSSGYRHIMNFSAQKKIATQSRTGTSNYGIVDISNDVPTFDGHITIKSHTHGYDGGGAHIARAKTAGDFVFSPIGTFWNKEDVSVVDALAQDNPKITGDPGSEVISEKMFRYWNTNASSSTDRNLYKVVKSLPTITSSTLNFFYKIKVKETGNLWGVTE